MSKIISSVSLIHCALHSSWQYLPFSFTLGMIVLKLILCGVDLSFHIIDYLLSASFPLYGIQLCYFSLIYSPSLPASLVITFCCLVLSFFLRVATFSALEYECYICTKSFLPQFFYIFTCYLYFLLDYTIFCPESPFILCCLVRIYLDEVYSIYI